MGLPLTEVEHAALRQGGSSPYGDAEPPNLQAMSKL